MVKVYQSEIRFLLGLIVELANLRVAAMSETIIERRTQRRHRVLKGGRLSFRDGGGVDCTVRNISPIGAGVDVDNPIDLPESFTLLVESEHLIRHCHAVWHNDRRIGIAFD
jgi:hypothetical protein